MTVFINDGACTFNILESFYDLDFNDHYFRRIKSVTVSIPCVTGPNTSVSATLKLTSSTIRTSKNRGDESNIKEMSIVQSIATSTAKNDSGMFELNFKDDRYLPFEGAGAISNWSLELPTMSQFEYSTISDVIINISYTARG